MGVRGRGGGVVSLAVGQRWQSVALIHAAVAQHNQMIFFGKVEEEIISLKSVSLSIFIWEIFIWFNVHFVIER